MVGDPDTGIYWPAANTLGFTTGGSEKVRIASTGHVTLNPVSGFSGINNSLLASSNGYMYAMGGTACAIFNDTQLCNAIGTNDANARDFNKRNGDKLLLVMVQ